MSTPQGAARLSPGARAWLLARARAVIAHAARQTEPEPATGAPAELDEAAGAFVTLHRMNGELRGCIGTFEAVEPLRRVVERMAIAAAFEDPRFAPLAPGEVDGCRLEISVLTPRRPIRPEEVVVGRHGLAIRRGMHRGVLLPQVATERGWDAPAFLAALCQKAGLPSDAWRAPDTELECFEAEVFGEPSASD